MSTGLQALGALDAVGGAASVAPLRTAGATAATGEAGADFSALLGSLAADAVGSLHKGEAASIAGIKGQVETTNVVEALMTAERSLQTTLAFRDKIVQAYLEITRMPI